MASGTMSNQYSHWTAFFIVVKANWGIGMMAMPYYLAKAGFAAGLAFFLVTMWFTYICIDRLLETRELIVARREASRGDTAAPLLELGVSDGAALGARGAASPFPSDLNTYTQILEHQLGSFGRPLGLMCITIANYGSCIAYMTYISDNMTKFVGLERRAWMCIVLPVLIVSQGFNSLGFLGLISMIGLGCNIGFAVVLITRAATTLSLDTFWDRIVKSSQLETTSFPIALGIAVFCNEGIMVLSPAVQAEMRSPSKYRMAAVCGCVFFTVFYLVVAVAGDVMYMDIDGGVLAEISLNFEVNSVNRAAVILYCSSLIITYIVVFYLMHEPLTDLCTYCHKKLCPSNLRENDLNSTEDLVSEGGECTHKAPCGLRLSIIAARCVLVLLSAIVALEVRNFGAYCALMGAFANSLSIYILPNLCYLQAMRSEESHAVSGGLHSGCVFYKKILSMCLVVFGVGTGLLGTVIAAKDLFFGPEHNDNSPVVHSPTGNTGL